jgi:hypothetical protein
MPLDLEFYTGIFGLTSSIMAHSGSSQGKTPSDSGEKGALHMDSDRAASLMIAVTISLTLVAPSQGRLTATGIGGFTTRMEREWS